MKRLLFTLLLMIALPAQAFTPETGWWWNPDESGRGFNIEVQDNRISIAAYVYEEDGSPVWLLAAGFLRGYGGDGPPAPYFFSKNLYRFEDGQCIGCPYSAPEQIKDDAGTIRVDFTSRTTGVITWDDGSTTPIQRHNFALGNQREKMLGEWRMVVDFSSETEEGYAFWSGDALIFDVIKSDNLGPYFDGYRRYSRFHYSGDKDDPGNAAGDYSPDSGIHTIVVHNSTDPDRWWMAYYLTVGINGVEGVAEVYCEDENDSECGADGRGVPVRGWRSASRTFVQNGGTGPAKQAKGPGAGPGGIPMPEKFVESAGSKSVADLTGDPAAAETAVAAARRLTDRLRKSVE